MNTNASNGAADRGADLPSPRRIKRRSVDLLREAHRIVKRKARHVPEADAEKVRGQIHAVERLLPSRKNKVELDAPALYGATVSLDQGLSAHFGKWRKSALRELVEALAMAVLLAIIIRAFLVESFSIPSSSMYPTLEIGDHLFISKIRYGLYVPFSTDRMISWAEPSHGDVIVFVNVDPGQRHDGEDYIKRVVAVPGDRIRLENDVLILNDKPVQTEVVEETTCAVYGGGDYDDTPTHRCPCVIQRETVGDASWLTQHITEPGCSPATAEPSEHWPLEYAPVRRYFGAKADNPNWPNVVVPEGHVLVMGDNRDNSQDGRFWGFVPYDRIKGKAFVIYWARNKGRMFNGMY